MTFGRLILLATRFTFLSVRGLKSMFPTASIINLGATSLERMHATFRPFKHRLIKKKSFGAAFAIVWITAGLFSTSFVLILVLQPFEVLRILFILQLSVFLFCLLIIVVSYSSMAMKIVCASQPHHHGATSGEKKLTKTLFIVTVVSLLLTLPSIILGIYVVVTLPMISIRTYFRLYNSFLLLPYSNRLVNPMFYTFRMPEFRRALFSFFKCRSQPQSAPVSL